MTTTIYTAGYLQSKSVRDSIVYPVNIARSAPGDFEGATIPALAPSKATFAAAKGENGLDWKALYVAGLAAMEDSGKLKQVVGSLRDGMVLMCWEDDAKECHRLLAAEFIAARFKGVVYDGEWKDQPYEKRASSRGQQMFTFL